MCGLPDCLLLCCFLVMLTKSFQDAFDLCCAWSLSCVWLFVTPWSRARQAPLSMGIFQARILEWVAMPSSRGSSPPRDWTQVSCIAGSFFTIWTTREAQEYWRGPRILPSPGDLPNPGIELGSFALQVDSLPVELSGKSCLWSVVLKPYCTSELPESLVKHRLLSLIPVISDSLCGG